MSGSGASSGDPIVWAAGVVILVGRTSPAEFLLMQHPDRWDLPKGHLDDGETLVETALRETREETGVVLTASDLLPGFHWDTRYTVKYRKRHGGRPVTKAVRYFAATLTERPEVHPTEHPGYRWMAWAPPHRIQSQTIDPLLASLADYFSADNPS